MKAWFIANGYSFVIGTSSFQISFSFNQKIKQKFSCLNTQIKSPDIIEVWVVLLSWPSNYKETSLIDHSTMMISWVFKNYLKSYKFQEYLVFLYQFESVSNNSTLTIPMRPRNKDFWTKRVFIEIISWLARLISTTKDIHFVPKNICRMVDTAWPKCLIRILGEFCF